MNEITWKPGKPQRYLNSGHNILKNSKRVTELIKPFENEQNLWMPEMQREFKNGRNGFELMLGLLKKESFMFNNLKDVVLMRS